MNNIKLSLYEFLSCSMVGKCLYHGIYALCIIWQSYQCVHWTNQGRNLSESDISQNAIIAKVNILLLGKLNFRTSASDHMAGDAFIEFWFKSWDTVGKYWLGFENPGLEVSDSAYDLSARFSENTCSQYKAKRCPMAVTLESSGSWLNSCWIWHGLPARLRARPARLWASSWLRGW